MDYPNARAADGSQSEIQINSTSRAGREEVIAIVVYATGLREGKIIGQVSWMSRFGFDNVDYCVSSILAYTYIALGQK